MRRRFMRRMGCLFAIVALLALVGAAALVSLVVGALGPGRGPGFGPGGLGVMVLLLVIIGVLVVGAARGVRRLSQPLMDLIEAAGRVEGGELGVQVPVRGPHEVRALAGAFNAMSARLQADEAQRRRLLADVTHELRTPLSVVQGNLEAILDGVYPADAQHLAPIADEARVLARLIDDLRTLALAEAGTLALHREPTDVAALLADVAAAFRQAADEAGVALQASSSGDDLPAADVDPVRTREVISNLVANALRYTPRGGSVTIGAVAVPSAEEIAVTVADTGRGIDPEALPHVFDRFYRSADSPGSGLGLAIVRGLVEAQGGRIAVDSVPGRGTTVRVTVPVDVAGRS